MVRAACLFALSALVVAVPTAGAARPASEPLRAKPGGFLTAPSDERPATIALDYVRAHPRTFELDGNDVDGLRLTRAYRSGGGDVHLQWEQLYRGIPVFGPGLRANVAADGQLINVGEGALPDPGVSSVDPRLSALDALLAAARAANAAVAPGHPSAPEGNARTTTFTSGDRASLTLFGGDRLAWRVLLRADPTHVYDAVVDADSGESLYRVNLVKEAADDASVFQNYPGAPAGGGQVTRSLTPWLSEPGRTRLFGQNAWVYGDPADANDGIGVTPARPPGTRSRPALARSPTTNGPIRRPPSRPPTDPNQHCPAVGLHLGRLRPQHDVQLDGQPQPGGDAALLLRQRVPRPPARRVGHRLQQRFGQLRGHRPRAGPGRRRIDHRRRDVRRLPRLRPHRQRLRTPGAGRPAALHPDLPLVERLHVPRARVERRQRRRRRADHLPRVHPRPDQPPGHRRGRVPGPNGAQPGAMDEGFADWYALDFLTAQGFETDTAAPGELKAGRYENDTLRSQAWDCPVGAAASACPGAGTAGSGGYTYGDFGKISGLGPEVHADGEIWVETLWDLRTRMIAAHGLTTGINRTRALVTDGLRLSPANPTFLNMRDAILQANTNRGFGDSALLWSVFAARGMGFRALTTGNNDTAPVQDFSLPPPTVIPRRRRRTGRSRRSPARP